MGMSEPDSELNQLAAVVFDSAMDVHRRLGSGLSERIYHRSLELELSARRVPFETQVPVKVEYRGTLVGEFFLDILIGGRLLTELKAVESLSPLHLHQVQCYLRAARLRLALLINFNVPRLVQGVRRILNPL